MCRMKYWTRDDNHNTQLFCSPNAERLPSIPQAPCQERESTLDFDDRFNPALHILRNVFALQWAMSGFPFHAGFVPGVLSETDSILGPLAIASSRMPIFQTIDRRWQLRSSVAKEWLYLKLLLCRASQILWDTLRGQVMVPLQSSPSLSATLLKFWQAQEFKKVLYSRVLRARKCLMLDAAYLSLMIAFWDLSQSSQKDSWYQVLCTHGGLRSADVD